MRFPRAAAALALAAGIGLGITGCSYLTPLGTVIDYNPSDGVNASVGDVDIRNAVGIVNEAGTAINLLVALVNKSSDEVSLNVQFTSDGEKVTQVLDLPARGALNFGVEDSEDLLLIDTDVKAGELVSIYFQYGDEPGKTLLVPVLDGTQAEYEGLIRESPTPTPTPTPTPEETPAG